MQLINKNYTNIDAKLFFLIFLILFTIYTFTSDGHRATNDEEYAQQQTLRLVLLEPDPEFIPGESGTLFKYPEFWYPHGQGNSCQNALICYGAHVAHSITEYPFVFINHYLNIINKDTYVFSLSDFTDQHYVFWRNSINPDFTFMELFFGPFYSALSVGLFFLICRTFNYSVKTSLCLSFLLGLSTSIFAYSGTSFNQVSALSFILLGFLLFRKYQISLQLRFILLAFSSLVFAFMIREDAILFIIPLFLFSIILSLTKKNKIKNIILFTLPLILGYAIYRIFDLIRYGVSQQNKIISDVSTIVTFGQGNPTFSFVEHMFGLLLSPGIGLFIYVPILLTVFFSLPDFFKSNKAISILILSFSCLFVIHFATFNFWHGLTAWPPKYMYALIPFLLLPLGVSIQKRKSKIIPFIIGLGIFGFFFNMAEILQDVNWFVWGSPGGQTGLFGLAYGKSHPLYINDIIIWTFQYSPLTTSINTMFSGLQLDVYLIKILGVAPYFTIFISLIIFEFYILTRIIKTMKPSKIQI
ncbi:MAG: hypothetical protein AABX32_05725 [Nanoarchaeota archaeon]